MTDKEQRVENANKLIETIAARGRHFFKKDDRISRFGIDAHGHITYTDRVTGKTIRVTTANRYHNFSEGGTLRTLIVNLYKYIHDGRPLIADLGPWPDWLCNGDLWGYGNEMEEIRQVARDLGILPKEHFDHA